MISGIYAIRNTVTNKIYIGSAKNFKIRFRLHTNTLKRNKHHNRHLQFAWNKYNSYSFQFLVLENCEREKLLEREQHWINKYQSYSRKLGYNLAPVAGSNLGIKRTEEYKRKSSDAAKGRIFTEEHKEKLKLARKGKQPFRNKKDWPHDLGKRCTCDECMKKKKDYQQNYRFVINELASNI